MPSLDDRLDISLNKDGTLKAGHADLADMPDTGGVNPDHDARYVKKSGDNTLAKLESYTSLEQLQQEVAAKFKNMPKKFHRYILELYGVKGSPTRRKG